MANISEVELNGTTYNVKDSGSLQHTTVTGSPDLDTYLTTGVYHIATQTATHAPTTNHATLFVDATVGTPYQIFKPDSSDTPWYTRHRSGSAWTAWVAMKFTDTTYSAATTSAAGLMSADDKTKLNGIASGAQVNSITGVKGNSESSYRTGNVNLTAANVGAVPDTSAGVSAAINLLTTGDSAPTDNDYYVSQYAGGGTSTTTYHRRPVSKLWDYIKSKLSSKGSATQPVYFSNGVPVATTYTLGKSVPSDAVFTDTTYSAATTSAAGLMSATDKSKLDEISSSGSINPDSFISSVGYEILNSSLFYQGKHIFGAIELRALSGGTTIGKISSGYTPSVDYVCGGAVIVNSGNFSGGTYWISSNTIKISVAPASYSVVMLLIDYLKA